MRTHVRYVKVWIIFTLPTQGAINFYVRPDVLFLRKQILTVSVVWHPVHSVTPQVEWRSSASGPVDEWDNRPIRSPRRERCSLFRRSVHWDQGQIPETAASQCDQKDKTQRRHTGRLDDWFRHRISGIATVKLGIRKIEGAFLVRNSFLTSFIKLRKGIDIGFCYLHTLFCICKKG